MTFFKKIFHRLLLGGTTDWMLLKWNKSNLNFEAFYFNFPQMTFYITIILKKES